MLYRVKQFIWGISARMSDEDIFLINKYLNEYEKNIFYRLPRFEQVHSVKVAKSVIEECKGIPIDEKSLIKAAFLHDVGKINGGLNLISKSIMVILDKVFPRQLNKLTGFKAVDTFYNHPEKAEKYLMKENERVSYLILNHHNVNINGDLELRILQEADNNN